MNNRRRLIERVTIPETSKIPIYEYQGSPVRRMLNWIDGVYDPNDKNTQPKVIKLEYTCKKYDI